jgi:hypothetical protein
MSSIIKPEVLPSLELPNLPTALAELKTELAKLPDLKAQAEAIVCTYPDTPPAVYADLVVLVDQMQDVGKAGEKLMRPLLDVVNEVSQYLHTQRKNQEQTAKVAWEPHANRAAAWKRAEREAAQREEQRINEENRRRASEQAEAQRRADAQAAEEKRKERVKEIRGMLKRGEIGKRKAEQLLREAGANEEADKAKAAADAEQSKANVQPVSVQANVPKVAGRRGGVLYFADIKDPKAFILAYDLALKAGNHERADYLRQFLTLDASALRKEANDVEDSKKLNAAIPGVYFWDKDRV